jgi:hypothetical protein
MKITLTSEQKKALELRHNKVRDVHECDRIKAMSLGIGTKGGISGAKIGFGSR